MRRLFLTLILTLSVTAGYACTNLIVTKGASADGSVMVTYAADSYTRYGIESGIFFLCIIKYVEVPIGELLSFRYFQSEEVCIYFL